MVKREDQFGTRKEQSLFVILPKWPTQTSPILPYRIQIFQKNPSSSISNQVTPVNSTQAVYHHARRTLTLEEFDTWFPPSHPARVSEASSLTPANLAHNRTPQTHHVGTFLRQAPRTIPIGTKSSRQTTTAAERFHPTSSHSRISNIFATNQKRTVHRTPVDLFRSQSNVAVPTLLRSYNLPSTMRRTKQQKHLFDLHNRHRIFNVRIFHLWKPIYLNLICSKDRPMTWKSSLLKTQTLSKFVMQRILSSL